MLFYCQTAGKTFFLHQERQTKDKNEQINKRVFFTGIFFTGTRVADRHNKIDKKRSANHCSVKRKVMIVSKMLITRIQVHIKPVTVNRLSLKDRQKSFNV